MKQPPRFTDKEKSSYVCQLKRSLYGLTDPGFTISAADSSLLHYNQNGIRMFCLVYVDDLIIIGSNDLILQQLIVSLGKEIMLRDLRPPDFFLGIEVHQTAHAPSVSG